MDIFEYSDYKKIIRERTQELQKLGKKINLKKIALKIPIQYTYLSKVLNQTDAHFNEETLFQICKILDFYAEEIDYVFLLRSYQSAQVYAQRDYFLRKIEQVKQLKILKIPESKQAHQGIDLLNEMNYLFDPLAVIIYVALHIPEVQSHPRLLTQKLGISIQELKGTLKKIENAELIELERDKLSIKRLTKKRIHYSAEHPLMKIHQRLMKDSAIEQVKKVSEEDKKCFQVSFTCDQQGFDLIKKEFGNFIKKVEEISRKQKDQNVFHLNFDLFRWT